MKHYPNENPPYFALAAFVWVTYPKTKDTWKDDIVVVVNDVETERRAIENDPESEARAIANVLEKVQAAARAELVEELEPVADRMTACLVRLKDGRA